MEKHIFLAFDLGATSGRSILGTVADGKVEIKELTRFPNAVTELHGKYYWNLMGLYQALREGLVACSKEGIVPESIGIDTWGVDVVPIAEDGSILSMPRAYRDPYTVGMPEKYFEKISKDVVYDKTGPVIDIRDQHTQMVFVDRRCRIITVHIDRGHTVIVSTEILGHVKPDLFQLIDT